MKQINFGNMMNLIAALMIFSVMSVITVKAQSDFVRDEYKINKGCTADEWDLSFDGSNALIYEVNNGKNYYQEIDRAMTGERRMAFTFRPGSVRVQQGNPIEFITSGDVVAGNAMYAIYNFVGDKEAEAVKKSNYLLPVCPDNLPGGNKMMDVGIVPPTKYFLNNQELTRFTIGAGEGGTVNSKVIKLNGTTLDTSDMKPGFYWFTLQTVATVQIKNVMNGTMESRQYAKTTPPVLIEIIPPPDSINKPPFAEILYKDKVFEDCKQPVITARVGDIDNNPGSPVPAQTLSLTWEIFDNNKQRVQYEQKTLGTNPEYTESITGKNLLPGTYTVKVTVKDDKGKSATDSDSFKLKCAGAGIVYFQFDEPFKSVRRNIQFNIENYRNPDLWGIYRKQNAIKGQCKSGKVKPDLEFPDFFNLGYAELPTIVENNSDKLNRIGEFLRDNPDANIYLLGYADFKNDYEYNVSLVERRLIVVMEYLKENYRISETRFTQDKVINKSNTEAKSRDENPCLDYRMHDRRVELIYFIGNNKPEIPSYSQLYEENIMETDIQKDGM